jgi:hypothetical protein
VKQRLHVRFNKFKNYFTQATKVGTPEQLTKAPRIEVFYGLYGLDGPERTAQLSNLLDGHKFLYPNPSVCCPSFCVTDFEGTQEKIFPLRNLDFNSGPPI